MNMLFKADKLMEILKVISNTASNLSSSAAVINAVLGKYNGMRVGFELRSKPGMKQYASSAGGSCATSQA